VAPKPFGNVNHVDFAIEKSSGGEYTSENLNLNSIAKVCII
jgi:hypothetical protein